MMFFDVLSLINIVIPVALLYVIVIGYRMTGKIKVFIMAPSLLYVFVFYFAFTFLTHTGHTHPEDWRAWFRLGLSMILISILSYAIVSLIEAKREYDIRKILEGK